MPVALFRPCFHEECVPTLRDYRSPATPGPELDQLMNAREASVPMHQRRHCENTNEREKRSDMTRCWRVSVFLLALAAAAALPVAAAEQKKPAAKAPPAQPSQQQTAPASPQAPTLPDAYKLNLLIRSSIIALNQANQTGNYTVLQDLSAPAFRASNTSARLAQIFGALRQRQLDLSPVLFFTPKLMAEPKIAPNGLLRLAGFFPTTPERVNFDLIYQQVEGQWRLFGIGVSTSPADVTSAVPQSGSGDQPGGAPPAQAAQKPDAAPRPNRKQQAVTQGDTKKQSSSANDATVVQNGATNNAARIDLANPKPTASEPAQAANPPSADGSPKKQSGAWEPFPGVD